MASSVAVISRPLRPHCGDAAGQLDKRFLHMIGVGHLAVLGDAEAHRGCVPDGVIEMILS